MNEKKVEKDDIKYETQNGFNVTDVQPSDEEYWKIDKFSLAAFPILFIIFNIIYWFAVLL